MAGRRTIVSAIARTIALALVLAAAGTAALLAAAAPAGAAARPVPAAVAADWAPIAGDAGWQACPAPITWSIDPGALGDAAAQRQVADLAWAFGQWAQASGLSFAYGGIVRTSLRAADLTLVPVDAPAADRSVLLTWLEPAQATMLSARTSGFAAPSAVVGGTIRAARGVFNADYVRAHDGPSRAAVRALYLHELGHALGLGHAQSASNRMYPVVDRSTRLGAGDRAGVRALTRPCS